MTIQISSTSSPTQAASFWMYLLPFLPAAFGAFFGAYLAFRLGRHKQKLDEQDRRHGALLATQYALVSQWRIIQEIGRAIEPVRNESLRFTKLGNLMRVTGEIYVPFKDITFIIDSDEPKLLQQIHIAEQGFLATISALDKCNEVRAGLLAKYPPENFNMQTGVGRLAIPEHEAYVLKNATDVLYKHVDVSLPIFDEQIKKISKFIECKFKGKRTGLKTASVESTPDPKSKE